MVKFNVTCCHITTSSTTRHLPFTAGMHIVNYILANSINQRHLHETIRWVEMESRTLKKACFRQKPEAQCAFKILMIHEVLQFALRIAFRCVLHRCGSQDIRCWKLYINFVSTERRKECQNRFGFVFQFFISYCFSVHLFCLWVLYWTREKETRKEQKHQ